MKYTPQKQHRITQFPEVLDDETAYSLVTRFHRRSGLPNAKRTLDVLFGNHNIQITSDFPSVIPCLSNNCHCSSSNFVNEHTVIPFYRPFMPANDYEQIMKEVTEENSRGIIKKLSYLANRIHESEHFYWCPECVREERERLGTRYWHCTHQIPGVSVCLKHNLNLQRNTRQRRTLSLPPIKANRYPANIKSPQYLYSKLATQYFWLSACSLDRSRVIATYISALQDQHLACDSGRIRMAKLKARIHEYWGNLFKSPPFSDVLKTKGYEYPEQLFYCKKSYHHPIKHLLLIGPIFGSWVSFLQAYQLGKHSLESRGDKQTSKQSIEPKKSLARSLVHQGNSLRSVAKSSSLSVGTVRAIAEQQHVPISTRPKSIYATERRAIWRKLLMGSSTQQIAGIYDVSNGSIEQILRCHPYLTPLRKRIRFYKARNYYRNELTGITGNPSITRIDIQRNYQRIYTWLYRHDREWMLCNLPMKQPAKYHPRKQGSKNG